jgi:hypothetical protein
LLSRCIPIVAKHEKLDEPHRQEAVRFYCDAVMKLLHDAVSRGYNDVQELNKDSDLDPLRTREDFQKLVVQLHPSATARARYYQGLSQTEKAAAEGAIADLWARPTPEFLDQMNIQAFFLRRDGKLEQARELRERVVNGARRLYLPGDARLVKYQNDYVQLLLVMQRHEEAEDVALEALKSLPSGETAARLMVLRSLVSVYEQSSKPEEADRYRKLLTGLEATTRATTIPARSPATKP